MECVAQHSSKKLNESVKLSPLSETHLMATFDALVHPAGTAFSRFHFQLAICFDGRIMLADCFAYLPNTISAAITIAIEAAFIINCWLFSQLAMDGQLIFGIGSVPSNCSRFLHSRNNQRVLTF